jgi:hypothetical protein
MSLPSQPTDPQRRHPSPGPASPRDPPPDPDPTIIPAGDAQADLSQMNAPWGLDSESKV